MGWKTPNSKQNVTSSTRHRSSVEIDGRELERMMLNTRNSGTAANESDSRLTQQATITVIGQILRVVGDKLENVRRDTYEITNYGQV